MHKVESLQDGRMEVGMNKGKKSTLKKVLSYIGSYKWLLAVSILLAAVTVALTLYFPILCGRAIDCIIGPGKVDFTGWLVNEGLYSLAKKMAVVILLTAAAQWLMNVCNNPDHLSGDPGCAAGKPLRRSRNSP